MKNVFLGLGITLCSVLSIVIVMTLSGTSVRQNELNHAVEKALIDTVENQFENKTYKATSNDQLVENFIEALQVQINSDSTIIVNVLDVDYEKGLLSVEVLGKYKHPIGTKGQVSVQRTVIMEQYTVPVT